MNINWEKHWLFAFVVGSFAWMIVTGLLKTISPVLCFLGGIALFAYGICYWLKNNPRSKVSDRIAAVVISVFAVLTVYTAFYEKSYSRDDADLRDAVEMLNEVKGKSFPEAIQIWHNDK